MKLILIPILFILGCGPLSPTVKVESSGGIDVSGTQTISVDLSSLSTFFTSQCETLLGASATTTQVNTCSVNMVNNFLNFVTPQAISSPSP